MDPFTFILAYEGGDLTENEVIDGFASLIKAGTINALQGHYGRTALALVNSGYIDMSGSVLAYPNED